MSLNKWLNTEFTPAQKKAVIFLTVIAIVMFIVVCVVISGDLIKSRNLTNISNPTLTKNALVTGYVKDYLPDISELPTGFVLVESDSGLSTFDGGSLYQLSYTNTDHLLNNREVNVLYSAIIADDITIAQEMYDGLSDPLIYPGVTTRQPFLISGFTNVDEVALLSGQDVTELNTNAINYTLIFRYQNALAAVIVSAPVDSFDTQYATQMDARLKQAVVYYASLIIKRFPVQPLANIPQPPFGEITAEKVMDLSQSEQPQSLKPGVLFSDDFENPDFTLSQWKPIAGNWEIIEGAYYCRADSFWCFSLAGSPDMVNYTLSLDIKGRQGVDKFVYVGSIEGQKFYQLKFRSDPYNDLLLTLDIPGFGSTLLSTVQVTNYNSKWYHMDVVTKGNSIAVFIDHVQVMYYEDPNMLGLDGQIGVGLQYSDAIGAGITSVFFDNVVVYPNP